MPPDWTTRDEIIATVFTVAASWNQTEPWTCGGIIQEQLPPGCFIRLDPAIAPLQSNHGAVGLKTNITTPDGCRVPLTHRIGKVEADGRVVLFFAGATQDQFPERSTVRFVEA